MFFNFMELARSREYSIYEWLRENADVDALIREASQDAEEHEWLSEYSDPAYRLLNCLTPAIEELFGSWGKYFDSLVPAQTLDKPDFHDLAERLIEIATNTLDFEFVALALLIDADRWHPINERPGPGVASAALNWRTIAEEIGLLERPAENGYPAEPNRKRPAAAIKRRRPAIHTKKCS